LGFGGTAAPAPVAWPSGGLSALRIASTSAEALGVTVVTSGDALALILQCYDTTTVSGVSGAGATWTKLQHAANGSDAEL
jgi:hypothetical protein